ncbi:hypothetical protein BDY19DRAFT_879220 [Irpex rosettiformis]|uniref:Uncharacterized protein n=1 Tax=Irpex rosettiformis TaxID=378272 RepID=A0ACB8UJ76_9APHY|nr:hypothetical protein BDY19DRAFT_879220 [Irpex rosettiformis]
MDIQKTAIFSFYRSFRRQINLLPSEYLRQFYRIKVSDDVRRALEGKREDIRKTRLKQLRRDFRGMQDANSGYSKSFAKILATAYGQRGPLKWDILKPILSDPTAPPPPRIIPAVERSRPPVFSPRLSALLMSSHSRSKPLKKPYLQTPPTLPTRADPNSEEARLLGPLSKRREVNIRWRYFTQQSKRIALPLQVVTHDKASNTRGTDHMALRGVGIESMGLQGTGIYEEALALAGPIQQRPPLTRRERNDQQEQATTQGELPRRWHRRRFQHLVNKLPVLTYTYNSQDTSKPGNYSVSVNSFPSKNSKHFVTADSSLLEWLPKSPPGKNEVQ